MFKIVDSLDKNMNSRLQGLDLSFNFASGTSAKMSKLMNSLAEAIKKHPQLLYLGNIPWALLKINK